MKASPKHKHDTRWVFLKKGSCSRTLFYILNRELNNPMETEEQAADPLAGGIFKQGYQCGMVWGATMAVGAEAYSQTENVNKATDLAIRATVSTSASFAKRTGTLECFEITEADFNNNKSMTKYMISGKFLGCFQLADKWAPEAIAAAKHGLDHPIEELSENSVSCASETVKQMGGSERDQAIVAGMAGGIGLSGNGCGALAAAIWMNSKKWIGENPGKSAYLNPRAKDTLEAFQQETEYEFMCSEICGKKFNNVEEHTEFVKNGGCKKLIQVLASS